MKTLSKIFCLALSAGLAACTGSSSVLKSTSGDSSSGSGSFSANPVSSVGTSSTTSTAATSSGGSVTTSTTATGSGTMGGTSTTTPYGTVTSSSVSSSGTPVAFTVPAGNNGIAVTVAAGSGGGAGVYGKSLGTGYGVWGDAPGGSGVLGTSSTTAAMYALGTGTAWGLYATSAAKEAVYGASAGGTAIYGGSSALHGVFGVASGASGNGVYGSVTASSNTYAGVAGKSLAGPGVSGVSNSGAGVSGSSSSSFGGYFTGVNGVGGVASTGGVAVQGIAPLGASWAGYFAGSTSEPSGATGGYGIYVSGKNYAIQANGPVAINGPVTISYSTGGSNALYVTGTAYSTGGFQPYSDSRLKLGISRVQSALQRLLAIRGVNWHWKDPKRFSAKKGLGVVAQDVEKSFPEAVSTGPDGYKAVNYNALVGPVIEAIREQQSALEKSQAENADLRERLEKLEKRLEQSGR